MNAEEAKAYLTKQLSGVFKQAEVLSELGSATVLISKKGTTTVKVRKHAPAKIQAAKAGGQEPGSTSGKTAAQPSETLRDSGGTCSAVSGGSWRADSGWKDRKSRYDKFRQINRFLEFIEDILPKLDKTRENVIIDFGCGKSYLTFAMYYYLHEMKGYPIRIIGLDLKKDVISHCGRLAEHYGYDKLQFYHGDIASYEGRGSRRYGGDASCL